MDSQTTYSSLAVHLTEASSKAVVVPPPPPASGISKAWAHPRHSFAHGVESVIAASGGIAVFLLFVAIVAALVRLIWIRVLQRLV